MPGDTAALDHAQRELRRLLLARGLRALADGAVAVLLPTYLLALGLQAWAVGVISTATLLGSALGTLALGAWGHRWPAQRLLAAAALLMAGTGVAFGLSSAFWPLLVIAFVGTLNPSAGDVSVFLPLEHTRLASLFEGDARTRAFARYTIVGSLAVPKSDYMALHVQLQELRQKIEQQESDLRRLRLQLGESRMAQGDVVRGFQELIQVQGEQFREVTESFSRFLAGQPPKK